MSPITDVDSVGKEEDKERKIEDSGGEEGGVWVHTYQTSILLT